MRLRSRWARAAVAVAVSAAPSLTVAQPITIDPAGGEVSIAGATLFVNFQKAPASSNDFIDADNDGCVSGSPASCPIVDQLAPTFIPGLPLNTFWMIHMRSVGSINGYNEFLQNQACGTIPTEIPSEEGLLNRYVWAAEGGILFPGTPDDPSGTPRTPSAIDLAIMDVPGRWATAVGAPTNGFWTRTPGSDGFGFNPIPSNSGFVSQLQLLARDCDADGTPDVFLNQDETNPDANTIFDNPVTFGATVYISNRGTGVQNIAITQLQHLFVTGRLPSGENLIAITRDVGSGTRNGTMNTSGIDPAWGRGDNIGKKEKVPASFNLGPGTQPTNCGGSSLLERAVRSRRLGIGYTGLSGGKRAAKDATDGLYEILNVKFDDRGGTQFVRPGIDTVLDNLDPTTGWQCGGVVTHVSRGSPKQFNPAAPDFMTNQAAADYLRNIDASIAAFVNAPADVANFGTPGEFLAVSFFLTAGVDALPNPQNPTQFLANPDLNQTLQDFIRANNGLEIGSDTPAFGSVNEAGLAPIRNLNPDFDGDLVPDKYSDGTGSGDVSYCYSNGAGGVNSLPSGFVLSQRNRTAGDFDNDGNRDKNDLDEMVMAYFAPRQFERDINHGGNPGDQTIDTAIPEVLGDHDGDGSFTKEDLRYAMDGLAMVGGKLNRKAGAICIDEAILAFGPAQDAAGTPVADKAMWLPWAQPPSDRFIYVAPSAPWGDTTFDLPSVSVNSFLATGAPYKSGDFRADVAGGPNVIGGSAPVMGAPPVGWDGRVDHQDINYVCQNFGAWANINVAYRIDLSCDINGDCKVDADDVRELVEVILQTRFGDVDLDGDVDVADRTIIEANLGQNGGWERGDLNCDGTITAADLTVWENAQFQPVPAITMPGMIAFGVLIILAAVGTARRHGVRSAWDV